MGKYSGVEMSTTMIVLDTLLDMLILLLFSMGVTTLTTMLFPEWVERVTQSSSSKRTEDED